MKTEIKPDFHHGIENRLGRHYDDYQIVKSGDFKMSDNERAEMSGGPAMMQPCRP